MIKNSSLYYVLVLVGFMATWYYNAQYFMSGGRLGPSEFFGSALANSLTTAITIDVYLAAAVLSIRRMSDAKRVALKRPWLYVILCFSVGLAIAFPLYLADREKAINKTLSQA